MPLKLLSPGGGSVLLQANTTGSNFTVNVPAVNGNMVTTADTGSITQSMLGSGVVGNGPAFSAGMSASQTVNHGTNTKVAFNSELIDTNNCYDPTTNYRFTPNVAGYYFLTLNLVYNLTSSRAYYFNPSFYKNGSQTNQFESSVTVNSSGRFQINYGNIVYFNGTTDYVEFYTYNYDYTATTTSQVYSNSTVCGYLVRAA